MNKKDRGFLGERPLPKFAVDPRGLRRRTRRDVLLFGAGALAALAGTGSLLPQDTLTRLGLRGKIEPRGVIPMSGFLPSPIERWREWSYMSRYLFVHGDRDEVLPVESSLKAKRFLESKGIAARLEGDANAVAVTQVLESGRAIVDPDAAVFAQFIGGVFDDSFEGHLAFFQQKILDGSSRLRAVA